MGMKEEEEDDNETHFVRMPRQINSVDSNFIATWQAYHEHIFKARKREKNMFEACKLNQISYRIEFAENAIVTVAIA